MSDNQQHNINFPKFVILWNKFQGHSTPKVHLRIAEWLEKKQGNPNPRLVLMAFRSCGKSTLMGLFCVWLLWRNPNIRILVLSADLALARKMVRNVKRILEKHILTQHLKPEKLDQWGADRFTVVRDQELRDPSMLAKGISANLTGTRADIIICDDVEVPKTCDTAHKREDLRHRLLELDYILTPNGTQIYVGTPHCWNTIYADKPRVELMEDRAFLEGFNRMVVPILTKEGRSVWPERFTEENIRAIQHKTGPAHFKSQMMCEPVNILEGTLKSEDIQIYHDDLTYQEAGGQPVIRIADRRIVAVSAWWDPAFGREGGDRSIVAILYTDEKKEFWLHGLEQLCVGVRPEEDEATTQCRLVCQLARKFYLPSVAIETNGLGKFLPNILRRELKKENVGCVVREITSRRPKSIRILEAFDAVLAARSLHVHASVLKTPFLTELQEWRPNKNTGHDDCLDAVAGAMGLDPIRLRRNGLASYRLRGDGSFEV